MNQQFPRARTDLTLRKSGNEAILYGPTGKVYHVLNGTALFIWERLDGNHGIESIEQEMRRQYLIKADTDLRADIELTIKRFGNLDLLELNLPGPAVAGDQP